MQRQEPESAKDAQDYCNSMYVCMYVCMYMDTFVGIYSAHQKMASDSRELPCGCWELNSGPLEEQSVLLNSELSLYPWEFLFFPFLPSFLPSFLFLKIKLFVFLCIHIFCLHVCLCITCIPDVCRGRKSASDTLELALEMALSFFVVRGM